MSIVDASFPREWTTDDAARLYRFAEWSQGYFGVSPLGNIQVHPDPESNAAIDLLEVVEGLASRDLGSPLLLRFSGVLAHRLRRFRTAFDQAIAEAGYKGEYHLVYPIKVNHQRHVCEEIRDVGKTLGFGLEVGSKPELIAALGLTASCPDMPIVCNGFKDRDYLELVVLAAKLGRPITPVIERSEELTLLLQLARQLGVCPTIGVRARLSAPGSGRWADTSGQRGKFGLTAPEIVRAVRTLEEEGQLGALQMLHCHVGSQVTAIASVKTAVEEMTHLYVGLRRMGVPIRALDLGGGLAVDYDGTRTAAESSMDYGLEEYVDDLVYRVRDICDEADEPHPNLVTESGRAVLAFSSVLIVNVLGTRSLETNPVELASLGADEPRVVRQLREGLELLNEGSDPIGIYHDACHAKAEAEGLFSLGHLTLEAQASCETLFGDTIRKLGAVDTVRDALPELSDLLSDQYYCNFSLFQSLPDSWAIGQRFPVAPIHRLDQKPDRSATLADITCDSDGRIDSFISDGPQASTLPLHSLAFSEAGQAPYYLGVFLVGAYQETLGDLHNLLGDTHAVHISSDPDGSWEIQEVVDGDSTEEVLRHVQYDTEELRGLLRKEAEVAIRQRRLTVAEAGRYRKALDQGLRAYTYLAVSEENRAAPERQPVQEPLDNGADENPALAAKAPRAG